MDITNALSQTMDIDVDFDGNQSYQPTRMISMFANSHQTFNFEDTELTFEFTKYIQQLCNDMEDAKNRIDGGDSEAVKNLLESIIEKVQLDMSVVNQSMNSTGLNATQSNQTISNNTTVLNNTTTCLNQTKSPRNPSNDTSVLGLIHDLFVEKEDQSHIEKITKLNILSKSLKNISANLSATVSNMSMNNTVNNTVNNVTVSERSILQSIREENSNDKKNETNSNDTFQENCDMTLAEATFINKSVCNPLMELISAVENKIDIERIQDELKAEYEEKLKAKDVCIVKLEQDLIEAQAHLKEKTSDHETIVEMLTRAKKENEVLDEIISAEKRKQLEKQSTIEELNVRISNDINEMGNMKAKNIELSKELNRLSMMEKENKSLKEQVTDLMNKTSKMFDLEKNITVLSVECNEKRSQIESIRYELKTNQDLNERLSKERNELMNRLDVITKEDSEKAATITDLNNKTSNLSAQLGLQSDKCDFLNAKLKETTALKSQLDKDRKDVCWQINELLKNPDVDFEDLKTFLVRVEEKINSVDIKNKPKGAAFVKSLAMGTIKESGKV